MDKISVIGLGKLGCTMMACFAHKGWEVIGVDVNQETVSKINKGESPIFEPGVDALIKENRPFIKAGSDYGYAIENSNVSFIIVPTPSVEDGSFSIYNVEQVLIGIAEAIRNKAHYHLIVVTSTVLPGSMAKFSKMLEAMTGKVCGTDFGLCYQPDFIALGRIVMDFLNPDIVLIGESDPISGRKLEEIYLRLVDNMPKIHRMNWYSAELAKIALNSFCTMKITFANILAEICEKMPGGDANAVANAIGDDSRIGRKYMKGALGFGGPCVKPGTLVQTDEGLRRIDSIVVGDRVITHRGRYRRVTKVYKRPYDGIMIKITSMGYPGSPIITTPDHPVWSAKRVYVNNKYRKVSTTGEKRLSPYLGYNKVDFIPAYQLEHADAIAMPIIKLDACPIPVLSFRTHWLSKLPARLELTPELMRFFGYYISEGDSWKKEINLSFHQDEKENIKDVITIVSKYFGAKAKVRKHSGKGIKVKFACTNLVPYLKETLGKNASTKKAPLEWLRLPDDFIIELLRGMWYGDGSNSSSTFCYGTVSPELSRFIQLVLFRFGVPCSVHVAQARVDKNGVRHKKAFFISIDNGKFHTKINNLLPRLAIKNCSKGSDLSRCENGLLSYNIKKVETEKYIGSVYNLEIDEDNTYVLEWGTVHNCFPRDNRAFYWTAKKFGVRACYGNVTDDINDYHKEERIPFLISDILDEKGSKKLSVLGLTYKEDTTLVEESSVISTIKELVLQGYKIKVYDPAGMPAARMELADEAVWFSESIEECLEDTDVCFVATPWKQFKKIDKKTILDNMGPSPVIIDAWDIMNFGSDIQCIKIGRGRSEK